MLRFIYVNVCKKYPKLQTTLNTNYFTYKGSASLIRSEYPAAILTAAHCVCDHVPGCIDYDNGYAWGIPDYPWINTTYSVLLNNTDITPGITPCEYLPFYLFLVQILCVLLIQIYSSLFIDI